MGRTTTPKYRIETWVNVGRHTPAGWSGPASAAALEDYVCRSNESFMPGGANEHVSRAAGSVVQIWMARIVRQSDGKIMAEWKAPAFATMPVCGPSAAVPASHSSMGALRSERQTAKVEAMIQEAADARFGPGTARLVFEHGHWWALVDDPEEGRDITYDVVDTQDGFDFERVD